MCPSMDNPSLYKSIGKWNEHTIFEIDVTSDCNICLCINCMFIIATGKYFKHIYIYMSNNVYTLSINTIYIKAYQVLVLYIKPF